MKYLSVIIPTYNSERTIEHCLKAIRQSQYGDYELIVSDDASEDATLRLAERYADSIIPTRTKYGRNKTRQMGWRKAEGEIIVNIDSDVLIEKETLGNIAHFFYNNRNAGAVTGILSKKHPNRDFFSRYKNIYMHYTFSGLPENVNFLYGSIYAVKKAFLENYQSEREIGDDTELGIAISDAGAKIFLLKNLEAVHMKGYTFISLLANDFIVPFEWARIFMLHKGWRFLGKNNSGFMHASRRQIAGVLSAFFTAFLLLLSILWPKCIIGGLLAFIAWLILNKNFFLYIFKEESLLFAAISGPVTFASNIAMACGIMCGFIRSIRHAKNEKK